MNLYYFGQLQLSFKKYYLRENIANQYFQKLFLTIVFNIICYIQFDMNRNNFFNKTILYKFFLSNNNYLQFYNDVNKNKTIEHIEMI